MKKIQEIDGPASYERTGKPIFENPWHRRRRVNPEWFHAQFTPAQQRFLETHGYAIRYHPRHNPTLEVFVNEENLTQRDWTAIHLLF